MNLTKKAEQNKRDRPKSEMKFAELLTERGVRFREQELVGDYITDFFFPEYQNRIVELDGKCHPSIHKQRKVRDGKLRKLGCRVMRVHSADVFREPEWLMHRVLMFLKVPHEPVSRALRKGRLKKPKSQRKTPAWAKVPRLTKDHLPIPSKKK